MASPGIATGAVDERSAEVCWYEPTTIVGTSGNDVIRPRQSPGEDVFAMLGGADRVHAGHGGDFVCGNVGSDIVYGDTGGDTLRGASDDDVLLGMGGRDRLSGGVGDDYLDGGALRDTAHAGAGDDTVVAREGRDALLGREGNDRLDAADSSHNDLINGGPGFDRCRFDQGDWVLRCEVERVVSDA